MLTAGWPGRRDKTSSEGFTSKDGLALTNTFGRRATLDGGDDLDTLSQSNNSFSELFQTSSF
jgi:hypothetical protein